ncbi:MAG: TolC family protein [Prolixibacteraceae bacterium]|jgi:outer membrane protein|nr:TolC family protein [Prolixibacteraceae bacterium]
MKNILTQLYFKMPQAFYKFTSVNADHTTKEYTEQPVPKLRESGSMRHFVVKSVLFALLFLLVTLSLKAQKLNEYVAFGIENNLALKQKKVDYEIAIKALKEAKGLFLPEVSINARYTVASGGRVIELPIGDLMNPVYQSLNQLMQLPPENQFPQIENEEIPFMRGKEQDTKLSLVQPLFNAKLNANYKLKKEQMGISQSQIKQYENELRFEIKKAYFNYLKAYEVTKLLEKTEELIDENLRINQKLHENNMATLDVVLRAKTEVGKLELEQTEAQKNYRMAQHYFNFLLNRKLDEEIERIKQTQVKVLPPEEMLQQTAWGNREELKQMNYGSRAYGQLAKIENASTLPSVYLAADYGFQGEEYHFTENDDYAMLTVGVKWTLFNGNTSKAKKDQALLQQKQIDFQKEEVQQLIQLELREAILDYEQKKKAINLAQNQLKGILETYRIVKKKYQNGMVNFIELLDVQNVRMQVEMNTILLQYEQLNSLAKLEKTIGSSLQ